MSTTERSVDSAVELKPITQRPPLRQYIRELRARSEYIRAVPLSDMRVQHLDTLLGNVWFLLNPLMQAGVYLIIFGPLLAVDRGVDNYPVYLVTGIMVFRFFSQTVNGGTRNMKKNESLMRSLYFPRAIIPFAASLSNFYQFLPGMAVVLAIALATGESPSWRWLLLPPILVVAFIFVTGCGFITSRLGHIFPDLDSALPHIIRMGFYGSGVLYAPESFTSNRSALLVFDLNPVFQLVSLVRWALLDRPSPDWFWLAAPGYATVFFVGGFLYFWRAELRYGSQQ